jgi:2,3-bisphosphoglycerate-dependent phosphoglycerate mutase
MTTHRLVLLRHGESEWNRLNLFTGWWDVDLSDTGVEEAGAAGQYLAEAGLRFDLAHTSVLVRAVRTLNIALESIDQVWLPVRRHWRLNERHYGALTGKDKKQTTEQYGPEQTHIWRRSYDVPPPPVNARSKYHPRNDPRYRLLPADLMPATECLQDVVERMLPYWYDAVVPDLQAGATVIVAAHGNSLRALVKHLEGISDEAIADLNIPTGIPLLYELGDDFRPATKRKIWDRYLDPKAARAAAAKVSAQAGAAPAKAK